MVRFLRITESQLKGIRKVVQDAVNKVEANVSNNIDDLAYYYNPNTPEMAYVKIVITGIKSGAPFIDSDYICIDRGGDEDECATDFSTLEQKMTFFKDFKEFYIVNGKATFNKA